MNTQTMRGMSQANEHERLAMQIKVTTLAHMYTIGPRGLL